MCRSGWSNFSCVGAVVVCVVTWQAWRVLPEDLTFVRRIDLNAEGFFSEVTAMSLISPDGAAGLSGRLPGASGCCQATARAYYGDEPVQRVHYEVCCCLGILHIIALPTTHCPPVHPINFGRSSLTFASNFEREIAALRSLRHRNLVGACLIYIYIRLSRCSWLLDLAVQILCLSPVS